MKRKIIKINQDLCNGCGLCIEACHEGAIGMVNGKAKLLRDDYCDGLGDCLPVCPTDAIKFEEREALAYDEVAVSTNIKNRAPKDTVKEPTNEKRLPCGCPSSNAKTFDRKDESLIQFPINEVKSELRQFPIQISLVAPNAEFFRNADLLIAADCTAFAYGNFHRELIKGKITLIGCPKLDAEDYSKKFTEILKHNNIQSIVIARMEVPCCGGLVEAVKKAIISSGKILPWSIVTVTRDGQLIR